MILLRQEKKALLELRNLCANLKRVIKKIKAKLYSQFLMAPSLIILHVYSLIILVLLTVICTYHKIIQYPFWILVKQIMKVNNL